MRLPTIEGLIRRRVLLNYRVNAEVARRNIPKRFRPKLRGGYAVAGICLIRLEAIRPKGLPQFAGLSSENAAHRWAVLWRDEQAEEREGVFIARRDTASEVNHLLGGRVFPGEHNRAAFDVRDEDGVIRLSVHSEDEKISVDLLGRESDALPSSSIFDSLGAASDFFERGSLGYSVTGDPSRLDGLTLEAKEWRVRPLEVEAVRSSFFDDERRFPVGSVEFDHALVMRDVAHEWHKAEDLRV